jgi:hypothetical protein
MQFKLVRNYSATVIPAMHFRQFTIKYAFYQNRTTFLVSSLFSYRFSQDDLYILSDDTSIEFHWAHTKYGKNLWHIFTTAAQGKVIWSVNCKPQGAVSYYFPRAVFKASQ